MRWTTKENTESGAFKIPYNWLKPEYYEALNILFRIENALRVFVYIIVKGEFQESWVNLSLVNDDGKHTSIGAITKKRLSQDKNYAYLGYVLSSPLVHLTSGELIRIITHEAYWYLFKPHFQGAKDIIKTKLDEIGNVRNSLAHFRPIKREDLELVKSNSIHILTSIETLIVQYINCPDTVPTNTDDLWYKELSKLKSDRCSFRFTQSIDETWVKIHLEICCLITSSQKGPHYLYQNITNVRTDKVLLLYPKLTNRIISVIELNPSSYARDEYRNIHKVIAFTFRRDQIENSLELINEQLMKLTTQIDQETELIRQDELARGKIVELVEQTMTIEKNGIYYSNDTPFATKLKEDTPVEFWGALSYANDDFITSTHIYPWMQTDISEPDLPF